MPDAPQRAPHRRVGGVTLSRRGSTPRAVETGRVDAPLREGCQAGRELGQASPEASGRLRAVRKTSRGR
eukprot:7657832-Pyramimonas_sp.AAC.1